MHFPDLAPTDGFRHNVALNAHKALGAVYGYIMQISLPNKLADVACLRVSQSRNCARCDDIRTCHLIKKGMKVKKFALVPTSEEGGSFSGAAERAALPWPESAMRVAKTRVPDSAWR